ncbi:hypothetical protein JD969_07495 [Planctomycetota bacterium]|nr:hypothetical protein JD969_07495 [Planctomycetota bacterium]
MGSGLLLFFFWLPTIVAAVVLGCFARRGKVRLWKKGEGGELVYCGRSCGGCGYDLRGMAGRKFEKCPECGEALMDGENVVNGECGVRWRWMMGAVLASGWWIVVGVGMMLWAMVGEGDGNNKYMTDGYYDGLSVDELVGHAMDEKFIWSGWVYEKLYDRAKRGEVDKAQCEKLLRYRIEQCEKRLEKQLADGNDVGYGSDGSQGFLGLMLQNKGVDDELAVDYLVADMGVFGVEEDRRYREGDGLVSMRLMMNRGEMGGYGVLYDYRKVWLDGEEVRSWRPIRATRYGEVTLYGEIGRGWHEMEVELVMGPTNGGVRSEDLQKGEKGWVTVMGKRVKKVKKRFYVYGKDEPLIELSMDEGDDPVKQGAVSVVRVNRLRFDGKEAVGVLVRWDGEMSRDCYVGIGDGEMRKAEQIARHQYVGWDLNDRKGNVKMYEYRLVLNEGEVWGEVKVALRANSKLVEKRKDVRKIWGGVIEYCEGEDFEVVDVRREEGGEK